MDIEKKNYIYKIILGILFSGLILIIGINKATKPIPISYEKAMESVEVQEDRVVIRFTKDVSNFQVDLYGKEYQVMAWKTNLSKIFKDNQAKEAIIGLKNDSNVTIYFVSQTGEADKLLFSSSSYNNGPQYIVTKDNNSGSLTLPRLAMNYYLSFMGLIFLVFLLLSIIFRNTEKIKKITSNIIIIPISYIIGHFCIMGLQGSTHHIIRDLSFVLLATAFTLCIIVTKKFQSFLSFKRI
ncbi:MAG: hypothetical protein GX995_09670 [Clostridiales bacterium]|nr:hypothetical protein [Clostridiales bacterium]